MHALGLETIPHEIASAKRDLAHIYIIKFPVHAIEMLALKCMAN